MNRTRKPYPSDLTDAEWQLVEPLILQAKPTEDPSNVHMREIVNAIFYVLRTRCPWEMLPDDLPHYSTVSFHFRRWQQQGLWQQMKQRLEQGEPVVSARKPEVSLGRIDTQPARRTKSYNVTVVEQTFALVKLQASEFASSFYKNLFTDYPQLQRLFAHTTMHFQEQKLMMSLMLVINNLRNLAYLSLLLKDLGERHVRYGAIREYYPMVGATLFKTLESYLGSNWTPEVEQAWRDAYEQIADLMLEGENIQKRASSKHGSSSGLYSNGQEA